MPENWIDFVIGPASGLFIALSILIGLYRLAAKYLPKVVEKHLENLDRQMQTQKDLSQSMIDLRESMSKEHTSQTEAMRMSLSGIHQRFNPLQDDLRDIRMKLNLPENTTHPAPFSNEGLSANN